MARILLLACLLGLSSAFQIRFDGHKVYRATPQTRSQLDALARLQPVDDHVDIWREPSGVGYPVDVQLSPEAESDVLYMFKQQNIPYDVMIDDLQGLLDWHQTEHIDRRHTVRDTFERYHSFEEIMDFMDEKAANCGSRCSTFTTGTSLQGRALRGIKITDGSGDVKPAIWIDSGIHAREWVSHSTNMYFMERLIEDYDSDSSIRDLVEAYDWYLYPVVNPDGYVYSWDVNRMWRKSRYTNESSSCVGTDVNRNYDFQWLTIGASSNPCSDTFAGYFPHCDPESQAQADFMLRDNPADWRMFITMHSYSQLWMAPWGYSSTPPSDIDELLAAGNVAADALTAVHGTNYRVGSASTILYPSSGTSRDWAKGVPEIKYVYTIELRDTGTHGFVLPPEQILPTGEETWAGVKAIAEFIKDRP